ncbi:MAG TPA: aminotransferase class V-fold PLP-dependent enzyme [Verrucomicrobiae bacterium]|nr:aminotransferase class V-fold PLP-dependent enzyme [Verrucomicrobiae bacterium]
MNLAEILSNEELRRYEFPVVQDQIYLAHGGDCPLPRRVAEAVALYARQATNGDQEKFVYPKILSDGRKAGAELLGCKPEEIAFVGPTSLALSFFASGLKFRRGDNILIYFDDYPSNVYPWMALADQGVEVRLMNTRSLGFIRPKDVVGQIDENTRLVALASCHFISGFRIEADAIGTFLRERNVLFCLDAIQTVGAFPLDTSVVDLLAADAHKWLLGPCGAGIMYVKEAVQEKLAPPIYGWHNVRCPEFVAQEQIVLRSGAARYEAGTHNLLGVVGLVAAMQLILEIGVQSISSELLRKRSWLVPAIQSRGYEVLQADAPPQNCSGITSFYHKDRDVSPLHQKLTEARVSTSLRTDRKGQKYIRLSPHFYNTDEELKRVIEML